MYLRLLILICGIPAGLAAQTLERNAISNGGSYQSDQSNIISFSSTIGEAIVLTAETPSLVLTQGFQQPDEDIITSVTETVNGSFESGVWPNPFENQLNIWMNSSGSRNLQVSLTDMAGRKLIADQMISVIPGSSSYSVQLNGFATGIYLVRILGTDGDLSIIHRINKSH